MQDNSQRRTTPRNEGLDVYDPREAGEGRVYSPAHGCDIAIPKGWAFLDSGDAFVTREVKKGPHWILKGSWNHKKRYRKIYGVYAPEVNIAAAKCKAAETEQQRAVSRDRSRRAREKREEEYRRRFEQSCMEYLDFAPEHEDLARRIAKEVTEVATEINSGRVGRTQLQPLDQKVELAVNAHLRHRITSYDQDLCNWREDFGVEGAEIGCDLPDEIRREMKAEAADEVSEFLDMHRHPKPYGSAARNS